MTVIVWDGQTLAGDKHCADDWVVRATTKIRRLADGRLAGASGDADRCRALMYWLDTGGDFPAHLLSADRPLATALVVGVDGSLALYQREPEPIQLEPGPQAIGSGAEAALVAMACGRTAAEAVALAARFCSGVGRGVDELSLVLPRTGGYGDA